MLSTQARAQSGRSGDVVAAALHDDFVCPGGRPEPASVEEVAPGIFVRHGVHALMSAENAGGIANIGFIIGNASVAVIDTGGSYCDGERLRLSIRMRTKLPIKVIINTHAHPDHFFGNAAFVKETESPREIFVAHNGFKADLATRGDYYMRAFRDIMGEAAFIGTRIVEPDILVEKSARFDLGGRVIQVHAYPPAHTGTDLTVYDEKTRTLFTGDLLFLGHLPVLDGKLKGWFAVMDSLAEIPALHVVPGHGPTSADWPGALSVQRRYLGKLTSDLRRYIAEGGGMIGAATHVAVDEAKRWKLHDEFHERNVNKGLAELEWE